MKKFTILFAIVALFLSACSSGKYAGEIDKAVQKQEKYQKKLAHKRKGDVDKKFDKKEANIYVYGKGKYVTIAYKPLKGDAEEHYFTYKVKNGKAHYLKDFNSKGYTQRHEADYKEENMNKNE
ncbi:MULTISPECIES: cystatin-like fold lipoprotein [Staphylococcus]|uniref:Cystatin-like fold lipoprotein n=1 Tax=Staphylococcus hsinchuensis TaxID=3051183 RepID=A0ABZ3EEM0_9STAP|nr:MULTISPECIES: cystatin-like fold lipoprotein [unclassified Staphylococcus]